MPRLRSSAAGDLGPEDVSLTPDDAALALFDRAAATWKRLGAPADLFDVEKAAAKAAGIGPSLAALEHEPGIDRAALHHLLAARYWHQARPSFLAEVGALTTAELEHLERFPKLHKHTKENR